MLVLSAAGDRFGRYYAEILRAEGLNEFAVSDIARLTAATLAAYDVVILADGRSPPPRRRCSETGSQGGGNLIAMRPDAQLAGLLGLSDAGGDPRQRVPRGRHVVRRRRRDHRPDDPVPRHGRSLHPRRRQQVAALYGERPRPTESGGDAAERRRRGGQAAAFTYDLARSVVYTRQGNPAWAGQDRDGHEADPFQRSLLRGEPATCSRTGSTSTRSRSRRRTSSSVCWPT